MKIFSGHHLVSSDLFVKTPFLSNLSNQFFFKYLENFEEALDVEQMYSKHRDSNSFREHQEQKKLQRQHPVNYADNSYTDLIDVNDMIKSIDGNTGNSIKVFVHELRGNECEAYA